MKLLRSLAHALIILALMHLLRVLIAGEGFRLALGFVEFGSFLPFSLSVAGAMGEQKGLVLATVVLSLLAVLPGRIEEVAHALAPIGVGILVGTGARRAIGEAAEVPRA